jgi:hypothetical protein
LAAADIWSPLSVRAVKFRQLFNLAVPANEFVNLAELGTEGAIDGSNRAVAAPAVRLSSTLRRDVVRTGPLLNTIYSFLLSLTWKIVES